MRAKALTILVCCAAAAWLAACGGKGGNAPDSDGKPMKEVVLSLRHTQIKETSRTRLNLLEDVVEETERMHGGVSFKLEGIDEIINRDTKLKQEMAVGNPPDVFEVFGGADLKLYVKAGRMLDLTPILEELDLEDKFESLAEFTIDGKVYGIPYGGYAEGIFYNKRLFRELNLAIPETWEELLAAAERIKAAGYVPFGLAAKDAWVTGMMWNVIMERHIGIEAFNGLVTGEANWTDPGVVEGFRAYAELAEKDYFTGGALGLSYADQGAQFLRGQTAMVYTGSWDVNLFTSGNVGELEGEIGFFAFPSIRGGAGDQRSINASFSNGFGFSSRLSEAQAEAVKLFISNYYNERVQKRALIEDKLLPSMKLTDLSGIDPLMKQLVTVLTESSSSWPAFDAIVQPVVASEIGFALQELIGGLSTPEEVAARLRDVQEKANSALAESPGMALPSIRQSRE